MKTLLGRVSWGWTVTLAFVLATAGCASSPEVPSNPSGEVVSLGSSVETNGSGAPSSVGPDEKLKQYDLNHDNKPDVWAYFGPMAEPDQPNQASDVLRRKEWDFNFDGKVDIRRHFNPKSEPVKDEMDLDFDGRFDVTTFYQSGNKLRQEYDFNFDNLPDYWKFYQKNALVRTERDRDFNGRIDRWEYYLAGKLDRIGLDEDGDGQIDKWIQQERSE